MSVASSRESCMSDSVFDVGHDDDAVDPSLHYRYGSTPNSKTGSRQVSRQNSLQQTSRQEPPHTPRQNSRQASRQNSTQQTSRQNSRQNSRPGSEDFVRSRSPSSLLNIPAFTSLFSRHRQSSSSSLDHGSDLDEKYNSLERRVQQRKKQQDFCTSIDSFETVNRSNSALRGRSKDRRQRSYRYNSSPELGPMDGNKYFRSSSPNDASPRRNFGYIAAFKVSLIHLFFYYTFIFGFESFESSMYSNHVV